MKPGLYLVGTPIGNMKDITLRALETLAAVDCIFAEDTRHTRPLLTHHGISAPLHSYHKFNERARVEEITTRIQRGEAIALVTDAGMPGISDPGAIAVEAIRAAGLPVTVIPGPCAVTAAVSLCGWIKTPGYRFEGFLDNRTAPRRRRLQELAAETVPVVFYESPHRVEKFFAEVAEELGPARRIFVGRELTKLHEETLCGTPAELLAHYATHSKKGEFVLILLPA